jgi:hypothetical protein
VTPAECAHGHELVATIVSGRWGHAPAELRAHAGRCEACRELVAIATRLREDRDTIGREIRLPSAGQVWWRSAVRARHEAQRTAARPLVWLYGAAMAVAAGLTAAVARLVAPAVGDAAGRLSDADAGVVIWRWVAGLAEAAQPALPFVLGVGAGLLLLLLPLLYVALSDD